MRKQPIRVIERKILDVLRDDRANNPLHRFDGVPIGRISPALGSCSCADQERATNNLIRAGEIVVVVVASWPHYFSLRMRIGRARKRARKSVVPGQEVSPRE